jgi:transposase InsO family protein
MSTHPSKSPARSQTPPTQRRSGRSLSRRPFRKDRNIVERIVEKVAAPGPATYPILSKSNYNDWSLVMKIKLQARCLWGAVDPDGPDVPLHEDKMAHEAICSAVPPEMISSITTKASAREAWESIKTMQIGDDRIKKASAQKARREYELLAFRDGESVEDFAMRLTGIVNQLAILGDPEPDKKVVEKYLRIAKPRFKQLVLSIETLLDISALSLEEITGRLKAAEDDEPPPPPSTGGKLYLTEEQWLERHKKKEQEEGRGAGGSGGHGKRGRGKWRGRGGSKSTDGGSSNSTAKTGRNDDKCRNCGKSGHWAYECRSKPKREEQAHVAQDDEPTLLFLESGVDSYEAYGDPHPSRFVSAAAHDADPVRATLHTAGPSLGSNIAGAGALGVSAPLATSGGGGGVIHLHEEKVFAVLGDTEDKDPRRWVLDTGATNHMTGSRAAFASIDAGISGTVRFGDGSVVRIEGCGTIMYECKSGEHRTLANVYYIPRLTANIISIGQLDEGGYPVHIDDGVMRIRDEEGRLLTKVHRGPTRLYVLELKMARPVCLAAHVGEDAWRWHARFGHINFTALRKMSREELVRGLPTLEQVNQLCDACLAGKHRRAPFPQKALRRATRPLKLLHGDLCGPISPPTPSGNRYFLLLVDDYSRFMWLALLPAKDGAPAAIKRIQAAAERKSGEKLVALRTDRGGEFTAADLNDYCAELGVRRELTAPYSPQQNGVVERRNQSVVATARCMLKAKELPGMFWGEAITTAVYLLNRSTSKSTGGKTPYELWIGAPPAVHHLRTFGCVAHVKVTTPNLKKLDDRSKPMIFVGYEPGSAAYRAYDPVQRRVHISRDVVFDEQALWKWGDSEVVNGGSDFIIEYTTVPDPGMQVVPVPRASTTSSSSTGSPVAAPASPAAPTSPPSVGAAPPSSPHTPAATPAGLCTPPMEFATPPADIGEELDVDHDDAPLRFRTVESVLGPASAPGRAARELHEDLLLVGGEEPSTFAQAEREEAWRRAMLDEILSIEENNTWRLIDLPAGHRPIGLKWVYKLKKDAAGQIVKHKARLVAKGYVQQAGVDFDEVFAPVARLDSVRLLLALAVQEGWKVHHMDVKSAFLNGELQEEVYVVQPPGFIVEGEEHKVYRLDKALYGLRQAPRAWNIKLDSTLKELGFVQSPLEHGLYARGDRVARLLVGVYVDDLIIVGGCSKVIGNFKSQMKAKFRMSDLGPLSFYLGIEVRQGEDEITLSQAAYASRIVEKAGLMGCNPCATPMEPRTKLSRESTAPPVDSTEYRSLVGSLRYLVNTRPDLAFSVGYVSRFMEKPTEEHRAALKHIIRYVAGTIHYGCRYVKERNWRLIGYSDSDLAGDVDTRKSTSGLLFFLGKNLVSWQSQK